MLNITIRHNEENHKGVVNKYFPILQKYHDYFKEYKQEAWAGGGQDGDMIIEYWIIDKDKNFNLETYESTHFCDNNKYPGYLNIKTEVYGYDIVPNEYVDLNNKIREDIKKFAESIGHIIG